ncbi:protein MEMO1 isoform X2 [Teleopsis dalmanni]|uniref:protein MEMO1 isoform X2 n=1 Tax=Teleopsis dalmanni TaxID=139649 RepID=UPI0018CD4EB3|nr:protein MEMO1 isoform X2 [Teleopsis dalmanni]
MRVTRIAVSVEHLLIDKKRIFILGPSHHVRLRGCALTTAKTYTTPLYDLNIDTQTNTELEKTGAFSWMDAKTDEDEHSIEMHLPFIAKVMENFKDQFTIVPILVGSLNPDQEALYGNLLADFFTDPQNLFIISSDFCHWGNRFSYTYYDRSCGQIYKSIENLDKKGMDIIETLNADAFTEYLRKYNNTICGRHPIGVMLSAIKVLERKGYLMHFKFLKYAQSSRCKEMHESSVSYASGSLVFEC